MLALLALLCTAGVMSACKRSDVRSPGAAGTNGRGGAGGSAGGAAGAAAGNAGGTGSGGASNGAWSAVPGTEPCVLEAADPARVDLVPFSWASCGSGCSTTPTKVLATDDTVFGGSVSARVTGTGNDVHVRFATMWTSHYYMIAVRRLSDGGLLGAVRASGPTNTGTICGPMGFAPSAPHVIPFFKGTAAGSDGVTTSGTLVAALLTPTGIVWSPPAPNIPIPQTSVLENDLGWGFGLYDGTLRVMIPPESGPFTIIDRGSYPAYSAVGWGSLVISNPALSGSNDEVIRAWEPNRPSRTIVVQADTAVRAVALSSTTMAWAGVHGPGRRDGTYTAAELYWTPFPAGKDSVPIMGGTALPAEHGLLELQTWGDYAVATGIARGGTRLVMFVVRLSDGRLWTLNPRPGAVFMRLLAVSPTEIVVGENNDTGDPALASQVQLITRYELAQLDTLAAR